MAIGCRGSSPLLGTKQAGPQMRAFLFLVFRLTWFWCGRIIRAQFDAGWSSLVARRAHNPKVASSNLAPATTEALKLSFFGVTFEK